MKTILAVIAPLFLFISSAVFSQDAVFFKPDSLKREIKALKIATSIKVDGLLNEPEWNLATVSPRFIQIEPYQGKMPNQETEVRVLYNQKYVYFGIICKDSLGKKAIRATKIPKTIVDIKMRIKGRTLVFIESAVTGFFS